MLVKDLIKELQRYNGDIEVALESQDTTPFELISIGTRKFIERNDEYLVLGIE